MSLAIVLLMLLVSSNAFAETAPTPAQAQGEDVVDAPERPGETTDVNASEDPAYTGLDAYQGSEVVTVRKARMQLNAFDADLPRTTTATDEMSGFIMLDLQPAGFLMSAGDLDRFNSILMNLSDTGTPTSMIIWKDDVDDGVDRERQRIIICVQDPISDDPIQAIVSTMQDQAQDGAMVAIIVYVSDPMGDDPMGDEVEDRLIGPSNLFLWSDSDGNPVKGFRVLKFPHRGSAGF